MASRNSDELGRQAERATPAEEELQEVSAMLAEARRAFNALLDEVMAQRISAYRAGWSDRNLGGPKATMPTDDSLRATLGLGLRGNR